MTASAFHAKHRTVSKPFPSKAIQYERWTAVPYRHPKEKKNLTANEMIIYDFFTYCVGTNPHHTREIEVGGYFEPCSMTSWLSCKDIASELEMPSDSVRKAKNKLIKLGWIQIIWFEGNNRSGNFQIGIPQCQIPLQLASERSGENLPDTTYSIDNVNNSPLNYSSNSKLNAKNTGDLKKFEKPKSKSINQENLDRLNHLFAEATNQKPDKARKRYWSDCWNETIPKIQSVLKFRLNANLSHKNAVEFIKSIIPKMRGKSTLARFPTWFVKTQSNGQENQPTWGLDFVLQYYPKRHLLEPTDEKFWFHLDRHKAPIIPISDQQEPRRGKIKIDKPLPVLSWTREEALELNLAEGQVELAEALEELRGRLNNAD